MYVVLKDVIKHLHMKVYWYIIVEHIQVINHINAYIVISVLVMIVEE